MLPGLCELHDYHVKWKEELKLDPQNPQWRAGWNPNSYEFYGLRFIHPVTLSIFDTRTAELKNVSQKRWHYCSSPSSLPSCSSSACLDTDWREQLCLPCAPEETDKQNIKQLQMLKEQQLFSQLFGFFFFTQSLACRTKLMRMSDDYLKKKKTTKEICLIGARLKLNLFM